MNKICFLILLVFTFSKTVFGQEKMESERRISCNEVPSNAIAFVDSLGQKNKVRWYLEEGINNTTIEAKFKKNKEKYSVEFDTTGTLQDVEVEINWVSLPKLVKDSIQLKLNNVYKKHKINKVQVQYSGNNTSLIKKLNSSIEHKDIVVKYEIIVRGRTEEGLALYEYLFNDKGEFVSFSKIIFKNSSNLEY